MKAGTMLKTDLHAHILPEGKLPWLHIELSPLVPDATPNRPVLYPVEPVQE